MYDKYRIFSIRELDNLSQFDCIAKVYRFLYSLNCEYPGFAKWYNSLLNTNNAILSNDRDVLVCEVYNQIIGVAILKHDEIENKICTLRVSPKYQHLGIGSALLERSFEIFNDDKPLITIHISKYHAFKRLFERYNFSLEQQIQSCYGIFRSELSYNGILVDKLPTNHSIFEQCIFNIEKRFYNFPSTNKKIIISKHLQRKCSSML